MKKRVRNIIFFLVSLSFTPCLSKTISGKDLQLIIETWLDNKGQSSNIEILEDLKYPFCKDSDLIINDISREFKLIKVKCIGKNPWQFIVRNKKNTRQKAKSYSVLKTFALKENLRSGTIIKEENLIELSKKSNNSAFITNKSEILGKKLKRNMNKNIAIQFNDVEQDWLIEKNSIVTIVNNKSSITIKESGIALENANFMDKLTVKNVKSGKILQVYAKNEKKVIMHAKQF